jgi:hypothetical protein
VLVVAVAHSFEVTLSRSKPNVCLLIKSDHHDIGITKLFDYRYVRTVTVDKSVSLICVTSRMRKSIRLVELCCIGRCDISIRAIRLTTNMDYASV